MAEKVAFNALKKLTVRDRISAIKSPDVGGALQAALTPTDFANLFPRYYMQRDPDIGGFYAAITQKTQAQQQSFLEQLKSGIANIEKRGERWAKRLGDKIDEAKETISERVTGGSRVPGLSKEADAAWRKLHEGDVPVDTEEGKQLSKLNDKQLERLGIQKTTDKEGKSFYHYQAPVTETAEVESRLKTSGGNKFFDAIIRAEGTGKYGDPYNTSLGYRPHTKPLTEMTMGEVLDWGEEIAKDEMRRKNISRKDASSAKGAFQIVNSTQRDAMAALGIGMDEKFSPENQRRMATWIAQNQGLKAWEGFKSHPGDREIASSAMDEGLHRQYTSAVPPAGPDGKYTKEQYDQMKEQIDKEKESTRKSELARDMYAYEKEHGLPHSKETADVSKSSKHSGGWLGESKQCVALSKFYAPQIGPAGSWKFTSSDIVPGTVIATTNYGNGNSGKMARDMPDGKSHYHTGIALTKPDAQGNVLILDQSANRGAAVHRVNINNYNGEKWAAVKGGEPTEKTMQAVEYGKSLSNKDQLNWIEGVPGSEDKAITSTHKSEDRIEEPATPKTSARPLTQEDDPFNPITEEQVKREQKTTVESKQTVSFDPSKPAPPGTYWAEYGPNKILMDKKTGATVDQLKGFPRYDEIVAAYKQDSTATVEKPTAEEQKVKKEQSPAEAKPEKKPESDNVTFTLHKKKYLDEIERKHPAVNAPIVGPGREGAWKQTTDGIDAEGITYETLPNGDLKITLKKDDPRIGKVRKDMKDNDLDEKTFLESSAAKEAKAEPVPQATQTAAVTKPEKGGMFDFVQPAMANELDMTDPKVQEAIRQHRAKGMAESSKQVNVSTERNQSAHVTGLNEKTKLIEYKSEKTVSALGITDAQYNSFRESVASIESSGGVYNKKGGSGGHYDGAYQFNTRAKKDAFRTMGTKIPSREDFRKDPLLQERAMDHYVAFNHRILMQKSPIYAKLPPEEKLKVLGYAHNQGAGGAAKWLRTGQEKTDAFGTSGAKYSETIGRNLTRLAEAQKQEQQLQKETTQVAAAQTQAPPAVTPMPAEPQKSYFETVIEKVASTLGFPSAAKAESAPAPAAAPSPTSQAQRAAPATSVEPKREQPEFPKTPKTEAVPTPPQRPAEMKQETQTGRPDESSTRKFLESQGVPQQKEPEKVPTKADGGEVKASNEVTAYPIGGLRGDNSIVVDTETQKPLFTMNAKTEAMVPDQDSGRLDVVPTNKIMPGSINGNANAQPNFMDELEKLKNEITSKLDLAGQVAQEVPIVRDIGTIDKDLSFFKRLIDQHDNPYQTPSFLRAMKRSSAQRETDDLHGHYSQGTNGIQ